MSEIVPGLEPEQITPPVGEETAPPAPGAAGEEQKTFDAAYVKQLRSEAAAARIKLKEYETSEAARKATEDAAKLAELSEVERLKVQLAETEKRAKALEVGRVRMAAAVKHGLPDDLQEFITAEDEAGALAQAEKLAAKLKPSTQGVPTLPAAGGRSPANGGEQGKAVDDAQRFDTLRSRVPALNNRVLRTGD